MSAAPIANLCAPALQFAKLIQRRIEVIVMVSGSPPYLRDLGCVAPFVHRGVGTTAELEDHRAASGVECFREILVALDGVVTATVVHLAENKTGQQK